MFSSIQKAQFSTRGFSVVEVILAGSVFAIVVSAFVGAYLYGQESTALSGHRARAVLYAEEGMEAVRNIAEDDFSNLLDGTYGLSTSTNEWAFSGSSDTRDIFTRVLNIGTRDENRKIATSTVTWQQNEQRNGIVTLVSLLTHWWLEQVSGVTTYRYIYAFRGDDETDFWRYNIDSDDWDSMQDAPAIIDRGADLAYDGDNYIYALRGNNLDDFYRYDIDGDSWSSLADTPSSVEEGGSIVYDLNTGIIYVLRGNDQDDFWTYSTTTNIWSSLSNTPQDVEEGGSLVYGDENHLYAFRGGDNTDFWRYEIDLDDWDPMEDAPNDIDDGGDLAYNGDNYIYALQGGDNDNFYRYNISSDDWDSLQDTPDDVERGGTLVYNGSGYIYAFRGEETDDFWRYSTSTDSWSSMEDAPNDTREGAALVLATGPAPDTTPPADISDLALSNRTEDSIDLSWTAPGDDANTGTATTYDVRYSTSVITEGNWAAATQATGEPSPSIAGSSESMTVSGLSENTTYYFAIKTSDEVPNTSGISNVPNLTTATEVFYERFPNVDNGGWNGSSDTAQDEPGWGVYQGDGDNNDVRVSNNGSASPVSGEPKLRFQDADQGFQNPEAFDIAYVPVDLSSYTSVTIEYYWMSDDVDSGEGLRVAYSTDTTDGKDGTWTQIAEHLNPTDDTWFSNTYSLSDVDAASTFVLRFSSKSSSGGENMYVDDVKIIGDD